MNLNYQKSSQIKKTILSIQKVVQDLYLPVEKENIETKNLLEKFSVQLDNSIKQVIGTRKIEFPSNIFTKDNQLQVTKENVEDIKKVLRNWNENIEKVIVEDQGKSIKFKQSLQIIEYWRNRATILNMIYQELQKPEVNLLIEHLKQIDNEEIKMDLKTSMDNFETHIKNLNKLNGEAKDNVKFLNTLERQFKNLQSGDFNTIEKTIPSLLNGLKLVFIISRHFKQEDRIQPLLVTISNEICDVVENFLNKERIFKYKEDISEEVHLEETQKLIILGKNILQTLKNNFEKIKEKLEDEGINRWDFDPKPIKNRPEYMIKVLDDLNHIVEELKKFIVLLGPNLKAVTGNIENIDNLLLSVKNLNEIFLSIKFNIYNEEDSKKFQEKYNEYKMHTDKIQNNTISLIETTFTALRSSESAFDLLQKFINLESLKEISEQLQKKYTNVLLTYKDELHQNQLIFDKEKNNPNFSKRKPPLVGAICWKRALIQRVKTPIVKFLSKKEQWDQKDLFEKKFDYLKFAKQLDQFEKQKIEDWAKNINEKATNYLKKNILTCKGKNQFQVNFSDEFKLLINEAKHMDKMGYPLQKTILNIALQEKEYYKSVDKLKKMLKEYNKTVNDLSDIEKSLFVTHLKKIDESLNPVINSFNLNSLGINHFINSYREELKKFNEVKNKVDEKKRMIEDIIAEIANTHLITDTQIQEILKQKEYMNLSRFYQSFESNIAQAVQTLSEKYQKIGDSMLPQIEFVICKKNTGKNPEMQVYYDYWERRIYNAIVKMLIQGLLTFKALISRPNQQLLPLFKVSTEFISYKVTTQPHQNEIRVTLNNLIKNIKEVAGAFIRWKPGSCQCYNTENDQIRAEEIINYTFLRDVNENKTIKLILVELSELKKHTFARLDKYKQIWEEDKGSYHDVYSNIKKAILNQKNKFKIDKLLEKIPTTENFEFCMDYFHGFLLEFQAQKSEINAGFIQVDFSNVQQEYVTKCKEALKRIGDNFQKLVEKQTDEIYKIIENYNQLIDQEADTLQELKNYLNILAEINNSTMDIEFQIMNVEEKYSLLAKYEQEVKTESYDKMKRLGDQWEKLLAKTQLMDESLKEKKLTFANQTQVQVEELKEEIQKLHVVYFEKSPGSQQMDLQEGYNKMIKFSGIVEKLNKQKQDLVLSEKLFNLEISSFPLLLEIEEDLKEIRPIFEFYNKNQIQIEEWQKIAWAKLDFQILEAGKKEFMSQLKKTKTKQIHLQKKIKDKVDEFVKIIPIIEKLKANPNFKESHWGRLMSDIGIDSTKINLKFLTLEQVFGMNLQEHEETVDEIVTIAAQESNNEAQIRTIEKFWKEISFEISEYKKGTEKKGFVVKVDEMILLTLNDHLITLQNMEGNKYAIFLRKVIREWVGHLNLIQETLEIWLEVQRKWMYLEGIFIGNEDITQQLRKESKNFQNYHKTFKKINEQASKNPYIFANCVVIDSTLPQLRSLAQNFDKSQKSLTNYLKSKKISFPRFYFISDDDLLSILGSSEVSSITPHLMKLFDNCKIFKLENNKNIKGIISEEEEFFDFINLIKPEGAVEIWMSEFDQEMQKTLKSLTKQGIYNYGKMEREKWIKQYLGMVVLCGSKVWWTWRVEDVFRKVKEGDKYAMKKESQKQTEQLQELISMVRSNLEQVDSSGRLRKKINTLIIIEVHQRDIVDRFVRDSILDAKEFEWESQLRFYWHPQINNLQIEQCTGNFSYGYEYQGLSGRLVITPLTDRCVMTLTTALSFHLGGAPAGPAGTGKTETCKDLAKGLARRCVVTNCGENFDSKAMGNNFSGLCQTGFWGCFDEFNRINPDVLSVVSAQIKSIQNALIQNKKTVNLLNYDIGIVNTIGIFVTMNPGYEGRSELPDNLKALFRPVVMVVPDKNIICENMLMSEGFTQARILAKKMTVLYKLAEEQLSKQYHYDFGLRALKSVLVMAGDLKRGTPDVSEDKVLMRALRDMNMPKFVDEDVQLFMGLINDLFPGIQIEPVTYKSLRKKIVENFQKENFQVIDEQVGKIIQLFETMKTRHTTMVVGPTGSGKSTIIEGLKKAQQSDGNTIVNVYTINPKSQGLSELYGEMDPQTRDWTDGILSHIFKVANEDIKVIQGKKNELRWILFDGDVDAVWVENMNSVMDDNKILTLSNGDRIRLKNHCNMLFEVFDLQYASPATISRCGMVYVDAKNLSYEHYFRSWLVKYQEVVLESEEKMDEYMLKLFEKLIPPLINLIFEGKLLNGELTQPFQQVLQRTPLNLVTQFTKYLEFSFPKDCSALDSSKTEILFVFAIVWSLGANIDSKEKERFSKILKDLCNVIISESFYDYYYDLEQFTPLKWDNLLTEFDTSNNENFSKILVPTTDTVKYNYVLHKFLSNDAPIIFIGDQGTAKTVIIKNYLNGLNLEENIILNFNFSFRTNSLEVQKNIEMLCDKKRPGLYAPKGNKKLIIFIDEMHMPKKDKYGSQEPIALLRFLLDKKCMYERGGALEKRTFSDIKVCGALLPPSSGYNELDPRFLSIFNIVQISFPSQQNIEKIYNSIILKQLNNSSVEIKELALKVTTTTILLYNIISEKLPRTPLKFHYIFNLRDLSKIFEGLQNANLQNFSKPLQFLRLWRNECTRVFCDRLVSNNDIQEVQIVLQNLITQNFGKDIAPNIMQNPLILCNFMQTEPLEPEHEDPKIYQEIANYQILQTKLNDLLEQYNGENIGNQMNLVLFTDAMEHLVRLKRIIGFPKGHALLVGYGGSGKKSLTKLATFVAGFELFQISLKRNYKEINFKEDLESLFLNQLLKGQQVVFLFTDSQISEESFLESINTILTIGLINNLFDDGKKNEIRNTLRDQCKKAGKGELPEEIWEFYGDMVRKNLHLVLCMSPAGTQLRIRCRNFPGLVSSTNIDWFYAWPEEALQNVAEHYMNEFAISMTDETKKALINHFVFVHLQIPEKSEEFRKKTGRTNFSTPKNYLDFLNNFKKLYQENNVSCQKNIDRFSKGLEKLQEGAEKISELKKVIDTEKIKVEKEKEEVEVLLQEIKVKSEIVSEKQKIAQEKSASLEVENKEIKKNKEEADSILKEKMPELEIAREKVSQIQKQELDYIRSFNSPPKLIQMTVNCLQILRVNQNANDNEGWSGAKAMLSDITLITCLVDFSKDEKKISKVTGKQIRSINEKLKQITAELQESNKVMDDVSPACTKLLCWVNAVKLLYETNQIIKPLKEKVESLTKKKIVKEAELLETNQVLNELSSDLKELNDKKDVKEKDLKQLTEKVNTMREKLIKAENLIRDLTSEKIRWNEEKERLSASREFLFGQILLSSSFLSYFGPFDQFFRNKLTQEFKEDIRKKGIKIQKEFKVEEILTSEVEIAKWNSQGLPNDELSIQNGILTSRASRYPLCIDPQLQALNWIIKKEDKNLNRVSFNDEGDFGRTLEMCIKFGNPMLIENVGEQLDPLIDPILEKNFIINCGRKYIKIGAEELEFKENEFVLIMVSKMANPLYSPEIMGKTSVINYSVTFEGLKEQLISEVVIYEEEEKEFLRKKLITEMSENKQNRKVLEDQLLNNLVNSQGSLLENDELIATLEETKKKSKIIEESIKEGAKTRKLLEEARQAYQDVAIRGTILFFCMAKLSAISEMYEYSLSSYLDVFRQSLREAKPENLLLHRINSIIDKLTQNMYDYVLLGIFEEHKLMFSFQMTIMILERTGKLNQNELDFFLKGNTSIEEIQENNFLSWLPDSRWKDLICLQSLEEKWKKIVQVLQENEKEWFEWFELINPEEKNPPEPFNNVNKFELLLLLKIFRPDRVVNGIKKFIIQQYRDNDYFVQSPTINFKKILKQSNEKSPILFILSPGADPLHDVQDLANNEGYIGNKFKSISLGQNMDKEAEELIINFAQRGNWAMLQNCDLLPDWLSTLEKILESLPKTIKVNKNFRLWLTTKPTKAFPLGILQKALKVVIEPPEGLRLNMRAIATKLTDEELETSTHAYFKPLTYVITYFHAILLDRRKFGKIGFNICYDFNESDFRISFQLLKLYLNKSIENKDDSMPWESLKYLIGEAMYGGRVTDDYDRRTLITYLDEFMGDFLFDINNEFSFAKTDDFKYTLPQYANLEALNLKINELPINDQPTVFGLNPNSEITYFSNSAKQIWENLLKMQLVGGNVASALENGQRIIKISDDIHEKIPKLYEVPKIKKKFGVLNPTQIVLIQELERFNKLTIEMKASLKTLKRALNGEIGLNQDLELLSMQLLNGLLPSSWKKLIPQTQKNLSNWIVHFKRRVDQYQKWIEQKNLNAIWLSGLHIPESYLTALVQSTCRKKQWALDKSTLFTQMTCMKDVSEVKEPPEFGCYVYGLFMEGASWDIKENSIVKQKQKELIMELPIMKINPVEVNKLKLKDTIKVPVYITQNRRNAAGFGHVFDADFRSQDHPSHWILQGVSIVMNTDNQ